MTNIETNTTPQRAEPGDGLASIVGFDLEPPKTYKHRVYQTLYELIQDLKILPGARLVEADLVARFGVSKTPIREALLLLEKDKLVSAVPHIGATVTWLSLQEYEQRLFILDALEEPALQRIVDLIIPEDLERCAETVAAIEAAYEQRDDDAYTRLVLDLHSTLFAAAGYPLLTQMVDEMQHSLMRYPKVFVRPFQDEWRLERDTIIKRFEHIRQRDAAKAEAVVRKGHAALLSSARARVEAQDPLVMPYLMH
jgi:DNA-binding GntR family transcriptional regulator